MPQYINYSGNPQEDFDRLRNALYTLENFGILHEERNISIETETEEFAREILGITEEDECFYELFEMCDETQKQKFLEFYRDKIMEEI